MKLLTCSPSSNSILGTASRELIRTRKIPFGKTIYYSSIASFIVVKNKKKIEKNWKKIKKKKKKKRKKISSFGFSKIFLWISQKNSLSPLVLLQKTFINLKNDIKIDTKMLPFQFPFDWYIFYMVFNFFWICFFILQKKKNFLNFFFNFFFCQNKKVT